MAASYKVPGVYVEEISKFPPSIAEVETAIPAFIGHTYKAEKDGQSLKETPTKIKSMLEFELYFGGSAGFKITGVNANSVIEGAKNVKVEPTYYLYDSLQLYFANGGGDCYIVSMGTYSDTVNEDVLIKGIDALAIYDEPTIILFPDAVLLNDNAKIAKVQQYAIKQCAYLMDRVTILDLLKSDEGDGGAKFRDNIGMTDLKYAAAYMPWIKASLSKKITLGQIEGFDLKTVTIPVNVGTAVAPIQINDYITNYTNLIGDVKRVQVENAKLKIDGSFLKKYLDILKPGAAAKPIKAIEWVYKIVEKIEDYYGADDAKNIKNTDYKAFMANNVIPTIDELVASIIVKVETAKPAHDAVRWAKVEAAAILAGTAPTEAFCNALITNGTLDSIFNALALMESGMTQAINNYEQTLINNVPFYKSLLQALNNKMCELPPSGAIAGLYCATDNARGVWKAPANISISAVSGVTKQFTQSELGAFNIDVNAGKSINAIRPITGQGTMVMGARTLAGNDNEWRYVPVRRFFNFVEESSKKSTQWAVFEPNDANLWLKVKSMIENFLYNLWRRGALAGAKPEHAYYVRCGLGLTMTAQDILEGKMNVEIGMATVRPAEFIVLKFSHKLQES
jgi:uncharacterized protein